MESKLRRLYLYAANTKDFSKDPSLTVEQYTKTKEEHLKSLKTLLTDKV